MEGDRGSNTHLSKQSVQFHLCPCKSACASETMRVISKALETPRILRTLVGLTTSHAWLNFISGKGSHPQPCEETPDERHDSSCLTYVPSTDHSKQTFQQQCFAQPCCVCRPASPNIPSMLVQISNCRPADQDSHQQLQSHHSLTICPMLAAKSSRRSPCRTSCTHVASHLSYGGF